MTIVSVAVPELFVLLRVSRVEFGAARLVARVDADEPEPDKSGPSSRVLRFLFEPALALVDSFPGSRSSSSDISITLAEGAPTPCCGADCAVGTRDDVGKKDPDDVVCRTGRS